MSYRGRAQEQLLRDLADRWRGTHEPVVSINRGRDEPRQQVRANEIGQALYAVLIDLSNAERAVARLEDEHFALDTRAALTGLLAAGYDQATPEGARETARAALLMAEALREERRKLARPKNEETSDG